MDLTAVAHATPANWGFAVNRAQPLIPVTIRMDKIVIRSNDRELLKKTWSIHSHDSLEQWVINEIKPDGLAELTIFLKEQYSTLPFVVGLLEFIDARIRLRRTQSSTELHITTYSDRVDIEVHTDSTGYLTTLANDEQ